MPSSPSSISRSCSRACARALLVAIGLAGLAAGASCGSSASHNDGGGSGGSTGKGGSGGKVDGGAGGSAAGGTGGGAAPASCGTVEPCGGNVVGTWNVTGTCVDRASLMMSLAGSFGTCPVTLADVRLTASGSLAFKSDMTYSVMLTQSGSVSFTLPSSCLNGMTCAQLNAAIQANPPAAPVQSLTCAGSGDCLCTEVLQADTTTDTGTFSSSGTQLTLNGSAGPDGGDYCVAGNELHLLTIDATMNMGPMGQATIQEDIVAVKQ